MNAKKKSPRERELANRRAVIRRRKKTAVKRSEKADVGNDDTIHAR